MDEGGFFGKILANRWGEGEGPLAVEPSGNFCLDPSTGGASVGVGRYHPDNFRDCIFTILQSSAFFAGK